MRLARSLACLLFLSACSSSSAEDVSESEDEVRARARWNVNDVSLLFPLPDDAQGTKLLGMKNGDKVLLPERVFRMLGDQSVGLPFLIEAPGRDQLWPKLRVTAVRIDPCFDAHDPHTATGCKRQMRLTAQPILDGNLTDASIHLFYPLDDTQFVTALRGLRDLKAENTGNAALSVHPVMKRQGLGGAFAKRLKEIVLAACDESRLTRMTFMATGRSGNNWFWGGLEKQPNDTWKPMEIPTRDGAHEDGFHQNGRGTHDGMSLNSPLFPDVLSKSENIPPMSARDFEAAIDKLQKIQNPSLLSTEQVSCATCHVAGMTFGHALEQRRLNAAPATPSAFVAPAGQNVRVADETGYSGANMHAFSWFQDNVAISARAVNESARVAAFVGTEAFTQSLSPAARAEWVRR
jgi:hypothetical protein